MNDVCNFKNKINLLTDYLKEKISPVVIYLFGSAAGDSFNIESDIDLAVLTDKSISPLEFYNISTELSVLVKQDIHLVDFWEVTDLLRIEILKKGKVLFSRDESLRLENEMKALSSYIKLNEEREVVIKVKYGEDVWMSL
ncbi:MAG: nucleotidyltransferase domain-containing protein [Spirochaetota bacterium]